MNSLAKNLFKLIVLNSKAPVTKGAASSLQQMINPAMYQTEFMSELSHKTRMNFFKQKADEGKSKPEQDAKKENNTASNSDKQETNQKTTETSNKQSEKQEAPKQEVKLELPNDIHSLLKINTDAANAQIIKILAAKDQELQTAKSNADANAAKLKQYDTVLEDSQKQINELRSNLKVQVEELELTRQRLEKERDNAQTFAITKFAKEILEVQDNMERAINTNEERFKGKEDDLFQGLSMTYNILEQTLEQNGVKKVFPLQEKFNPNLHESLFEIEDAKAEPGTVALVSQPGYIIGDRLLRAAKVGVFKQATTSTPPPAQEEQAEKQ